MFHDFLVISLVSSIPVFLGDGYQDNLLGQTSWMHLRPNLSLHQHQQGIYLYYPEHEKLLISVFALNWGAKLMATLNKGQLHRWWRYSSFIVIF